MSCQVERFFLKRAIQQLCNEPAAEPDLSNLKERNSNTMDYHRPAVVSQPFVAVHPNGQHQAFQLVILEAEAARKKDPWWWNCQVSLNPLFPGKSECGGVTQFHALASAIAFATHLLSKFIASGGKLLLPTGEDAGVPRLHLAE